MPHKGVIGRAHWAARGWQSLAHTFAAPRVSGYPEPFRRRTARGEFKERALRFRTEVEGTPQWKGCRYRSILERNPALADRLHRRFELRARHVTQSRGEAAAEDRKSVRVGRAREIAQWPVDDDTHDRWLRSSRRHLGQIFRRWRDEERGREAPLP